MSATHNVSYPHRGSGMRLAAVCSNAACPQAGIQLFPPGQASRVSQRAQVEIPIGSISLLDHQKPLGLLVSNGF